MRNTLKLKKNYEFKYILKRGKYYSGNYIEFFYIRNNKNYNNIGIAISSKLCNAVKRNKIKRIIREAYYSLENKLTLGNTFVFLWKKNVSIENCSYSNVLNDMVAIFSKIGINIDEKNND